jgi:hypothetical protein
MISLSKTKLHFCIGHDLAVIEATIMKFELKFVSTVILVMTYDFTAFELNLSQELPRLEITYQKYFINKLKCSQEYMIQIIHHRFSHLKVSLSVVVYFYIGHY